MATKPLNPLVQWAQREQLLFLTIEVDKVEALDITAKNLHVKGKYAGAETQYEATIEFYADIKTDYRKSASGRNLELVINKEAAGWWPRLLKGTGKVAWVKVDFNKWKDEDDEEEDLDAGGPGGFDFNKYMANMGGDQGGMAGGAPNLDDFDDEDEDTEDMPDLEDTEDEKKVEDEKKAEKSAEVGKDKENAENGHAEPKAGTASGDGAQEVPQEAA
ncbi:unnamed protein product [Anisakis simplex]|uniref:Hsp90 co-chaperone (Tebp), putative (inferred by orthology to a S. mansoni protein) n=1 Tax=Anisakis simplex TaxID=6269 RepID=A0A0M3K364_ANISI|nr:unnamed protein product [Anisakis simplex]